MVMRRGESCEDTHASKNACCSWGIVPLTDSKDDCQSRASLNVLIAGVDSDSLQFSQWISI